MTNAAIMPNFIHVIGDGGRVADTCENCIIWYRGAYARGKIGAETNSYF